METEIRKIGGGASIDLVRARKQAGPITDAPCGLSRQPGGGSVDSPMCRLYSSAMDSLFPKCTSLVWTVVLALSIVGISVAIPAAMGTAAASRLTAEGPQASSFADWVSDIRSQALAAGISEATFDAAFADIEPIERVVELDRNQPEVRLDFWTYLDRVGSEERVERGRLLLSQHEDLLVDLTARYGIPGPVLVSVWGIESNFGDIQGGFPVIDALATLAFDGRRAAMFSSELIHALRILEDGHIDLPDMQGSWAGAMGQVQFMPSTFVDFAKDGDGDGRRDIWGSTPDALESAASFMATVWRGGYIWGRQVQLPPGFDSDLADLDTSKPLDEWQNLGVRRIDGSALPTADIQGSIILPSENGAAPAFLVYQNYRALMRWNRSHFFAITVGHLADRIAGQGRLVR